MQISGIHFLWLFVQTEKVTSLNSTKLLSHSCEVSKSKWAFGGGGGNERKIYEQPLQRLKLINIEDSVFKVHGSLSPLKHNH